MAERKLKKRITKTNVGVLLPVDLYRRFRMHCIEIGERPGNLITELIKDYMKLQEKREKSK